MKFGLLKSKIEKHLLESYSKDIFKDEIKIFKKLVLEDKKISKLYNLYDELNKNKGFNKEYAEEYLKESVNVYSNNIPEMKSIELLEWWVGEVKTNNQYESIDIFLSKDDISIENIIESKNKLVESLTKKEVVSETIKIPIKKMVEVSNKTIESYLENLNENDRQEIKKIISLSEDELKTRYNLLSEIAIERLEKTKSDVDGDTKKQIDDVIEKIKTEEINHISYVKLKELSNSI